MIIGAVQILGNLGKLSNYMQYFGSNNVEGVAESWVGAEMSWVKMDVAGCDDDYHMNTYHTHLDDVNMSILGLTFAKKGLCDVRGVHAVSDEF